MVSYIYFLKNNLLLASYFIEACMLLWLYPVFLILWELLAIMCEMYNTNITVITTTISSPFLCSNLLLLIGYSLLFFVFFVEGYG